MNISIHAPPRGATAHLLKYGDCGIISIHAPPRGATNARKALISAQYISIHAPPRGATSWAQLHHLVVAFQFTPLREGRPACKRDGGGQLIISIHAPPRGATALFPWLAFFSPISIHAPPRGATVCVPVTIRV